MTCTCGERAATHSAWGLILGRPFGIHGCVACLNVVRAACERRGEPFVSGPFALFGTRR